MSSVSSVPINQRKHLTSSKNKPNQKKKSLKSLVQLNCRARGNIRNKKGILSKVEIVPK